MAFSVSVAVHIGAHKTATTHLQQTLEHNAPDLTSGDVAVLGPSYLRQPGQEIESLFGLRGLPAPPEGGHDAALRLSGGKTRLFMTEENFIGVFRTPSGDIRRPLYPHAEERLSALAEALAPAPLDVYLSVRHPVDWLSSCFSQVLLGGEIVQPASYFLNNSPDSIDWAALVRRIRAQRNIRTIGVWPYENYPRNAQFILRQMLRRRVGGLVVPPREYSNQGLSLEAVRKVLDPDTAMTALEARVQYPIGEEYPKFQPVPDELRAEFDALYRDQLEQIAQMPGVQFLG